MSLVAIPKPADWIPGVNNREDTVDVQNLHLAELVKGKDTTEPRDNGEGIITIPSGGIFEVNGVLFCVPINADIILHKPNPYICYWVAVNGKGYAELVTRPGIWDNVKLGCYLADGRRTLNWASDGELANLTEPEMGLFPQNVKGTHTIQLRKGWYYVELASGKGGGDGGTSTYQGTYNSYGGIANKENVVKHPIFVSSSVSALVFIGGTGYDGGKGGSGHNLNSQVFGTGGGGGSGGGERSFIKIGKETILIAHSVLGGDGGNGTSGLRGTSVTENPGGGGGGGGGIRGGAGGSRGYLTTGSGGIGGSLGLSGGNGGGKGEPVIGTDDVTGYGGGGGSGNSYLRGSSGGGGGGGGQQATFVGGDGGTAGISSNGEAGKDGNVSQIYPGIPIYIGAGGGGGGQGSHGRERPIGGLGGRCYIYSIGK